jgi:hypothetical protein
MEGEESTALLPEFYKQGCFLDRVVNFQNVFDEFKALFACNQSLVLQDYLFGSPAPCYTSLFFEAATQQAIHRDITYFWTCPAYMYFGMWTALEEVTLENGPLLVVPGSHRIGDIDRSRIVQDKYSRKSVARRDRDLAVEYQRLLLERCGDMGFSRSSCQFQKGPRLFGTPFWHMGELRCLICRSPGFLSWFIRLRNMRLLSASPCRHPPAAPGRSCRRRRGRRRGSARRWPPPLAGPSGPGGWP